MRTAVLVALCACSQVDTAWDAATGDGTVYECDIGGGRILEYCYHDDSAEELGYLVGGTCDGSSRSWPWLANLLDIGCVYECPHIGPGANAKNGEFCE